MTRATLNGQWTALVERAEKLYAEFRASRLCWQVGGAVLLVALSALVTVLPGEPAARVRLELNNLVRQDYDFAGQWQKTDRWAKSKGGWGPATAGLWNDGITRIKRFVATLPGASKLEEAEPPAGSTAANGSPAGGGAQPGGPGAGGQTGGAPGPAPGKADTALPVTGRVSYGFGWLAQGRSAHQGLDLGAAVGAPVKAIADGTVLRFGTDPYAGGIVEVDHGFGVALYGQVTAIRVKAGDKVTRGQVIATIAKPTGKEGDAAPHLHLEMRAAKGAATIDPAPFLPQSGGGSGH